MMLRAYMKRHAARFYSDDSGAAAISFVLAAALTCVWVCAGLTLTGQKIPDVLRTVAYVFGL